MSAQRKIKFNLMVGLLLTMLLSTTTVYGAEGFIGSLQETFGPKMEGEKGRVPLVTYISEGGVMVGQFWYDSNLFDNNTKFTSVLLASPSTGILTSFNQFRDY
ncbi:MAG: hypothetical protein ACQERJ_04785, partial [Bacillota bacterium]